MAPIIGLIALLLTLYSYIVIIDVVLSLLINFNVINNSNDFVRQIHTFTYKMTNPVYSKIRSVIPPIGGIDLSPLIVLIAIWFIRASLVYYF